MFIAIYGRLVSGNSKPATMSSNDDTMTYQNLRRNLPEQPMMPTAPIYVSVPPVDNLPENRREEMVPLCASPSLDAKKRLRIEAEIKKAQLRREQLVKERQIMEEEFKAKEMLLNAELELVQLENNSVNSVSAQDQVLKLKTRGLNANSRIERPVELPKPLGEFVFVLFAIYLINCILQI